MGRLDTHVISNNRQGVNLEHLSGREATLNTSKVGKGGPGLCIFCPFVALVYFYFVAVDRSGKVFVVAPLNGFI